jgi:CO/xanthine dehydrogenase FAD-binding subunit
MLLPKFDFHEPKTVEEACQILSEYGKKARLIAGGTDLMVNLKKKVIAPEHLVSLSRIESLKSLEKTKDVLKIGAGFIVADLIDTKSIKDTVSALSAGAGALGSPLIRNLATIGGNIGSARPAADLPPALMAYGSTLILKSSKGERSVSMDSIIRGPGVTDCQPDELITEIHVTLPKPGSGAGYINLGARKAQDCNIVNVASYISLDANGVIQTARVIMGCVGPTHLHAPSAEKFLTGEKPDLKLFEKAADEAQKDCIPITDFRGSSDYKRAMVGELIRRTLGIALSEAKA